MTVEHGEVVKFLSSIFRRILTLFKGDFFGEPTKILLRTGKPEVERIPDYIKRALEDDSDGYLTPYQVAFYHPLSDEKPEKAVKETIADVERLIKVGWLKVSLMLYPIRKVIIPGWIYNLLEQEMTISEKEKKERLGLLHGRIQADSAHVEDLTDTAILEEKGFFKSRDFMGMSFTLKAHQMIGKNLYKWLNLSKAEIIGTYHTHLIPYCHTPSFKDMVLLMANPGKPHLILCGKGLFAYTFRSFKRFFSPTFPMRVSQKILSLASIDGVSIEKIP